MPAPGQCIILKNSPISEGMIAIQIKNLKAVEGLAGEKSILIVFINI